MIARKLKEVDQALNSITAREDLARFLDDTENAQKLNDLVGDLRDVLTDYQVCAPKPLGLIASNDVLDLVAARRIRQ